MLIPSSHRRSFVQSLVKGKRLLYLQQNGPTEQFINQHTAEAEQQLQQSFSSLLEQNTATLAQIEQVFDERQQALQQSLQPFKEMAVADSLTQERIQQIEQAVSERLNAIKQRVLTGLDFIGVREQSQQLQEEYEEEFLGFLERTLASDQIADVQDRIHIPPRSQARDTSDATPDASPEEAPETSDVPPTAQEINRVWLDFPKEFNGNGLDSMDMEFVRGAFYPIYESFREGLTHKGKGTKEGARLFIKDKMGGFNDYSRIANNSEFGSMLNKAHEAFKKYVEAEKATGSTKDLRQFRIDFFDTGMRVDANGNWSHTKPEINRYFEEQRAAEEAARAQAEQEAAERQAAEQAQREQAERAAEEQAEAAERARNAQMTTEQRQERAAQIEQAWQQEVAERPFVSPQQQYSALESIESRIEEGETPRVEDLKILQKLINTTNSDILENDQPITWQTVSESSLLYPAQYRSNGHSQPPRMRVNGKVIDLELSFDNPPNNTPVNERQFTYVHALRPDGSRSEVDLPRLMITLEHLSSTFPELKEGKTDLNLGEIANHIQRNPDRIREQLQQRKLNEMLSSVGIPESEMTHYRNLPQALTRLLQLNDSEIRMSSTEWNRHLQSMVLDRSMRENDYRFLWVIRILTRTRVVPEQQNMNIEDFSQLLLTNTTYPQSTFFERMPILSELESPEMPPEIGQSASVVEESRYRYNMVSEYKTFRDQIPAIGQLYDFAYLLRSDTRDSLPLPRAFKNLSLRPWSITMTFLEKASQVPAVTNINNRPYVVIDAAVAGAQMILPKRLVDKYKEMKMNNPFFKELVNLAQHQESQIDVSFDNIQDHLVFQEIEDSRIYQDARERLENKLLPIDATFEQLLVQIFTPRSAYTSELNLEVPL